MKLICNGDDFGITKACNYAIIDCYKDGILTSTSMMSNMPGAQHASQLMKDYPGLSVGLHLNLTVGKPITQGLKTIVKEDGNLNKEILKDADNVDMLEIQREIKAQFNRFVELCGQLPTHINSHHGIEQIPGTEVFILELSRAYNLPIRRFFTLPQGNHPQCDYVIPKMYLIQRVDWSIPITEDEIIHSFTKEMLKSDDIYEIAAHPGYVDYNLLQLSSLTTGRCYDAHNFLSDKMKHWIHEHAISLINYEAIPKIK